MRARSVVARKHDHGAWPCAAAYMRAEMIVNESHANAARNTANALPITTRLSVDRRGSTSANGRPHFGQAGAASDT